MIPKQFRAILFDMDGVIVDDETLHEDASREVLRAEGLKLSHADYQRFFVGRTDNDGFKAYQDSLGLKIDLTSLLRKKAAAFRELASRGLKSYPGTLELIRRLSDHGLLLALVTSAIRQEAETVLKTFKLARRFSVVITAEDIEGGKPAPDCYLLALHRLGVEPDDGLVIEDSPSGIAAAQAAGIRCLAVPYIF